MKRDVENTCTKALKYKRHLTRGCIDLLLYFLMFVYVVEYYCCLVVMRNCIASHNI